MKKYAEIIVCIACNRLSTIFTVFHIWIVFRIWTMNEISIDVSLFVCTSPFIWIEKNCFYFYFIGSNNTSSVEMRSAALVYLFVNLTTWQWESEDEKERKKELKQKQNIQINELRWNGTSSRSERREKIE